MLKKVFIISGTIILTGLILAWGYLLLFDLPESTKQTFANLGLVNTTTERPEAEQDSTPITQLAADSDLQQLTTKQVAGFVYTSNNTGTSTETTPGGTIFYAERGTGYIYKIDLSTNLETQVSGTTIGQTIDATFNPTGTAVVLVTEENGDKEAQLLTLSEDGSTEKLPTKSNNFGWINGVLNYTITNDEGSTAYSRESGISTVRWQLPLREIDVFWRDGGDVVVNKHAPHLRGGMFRVTNSSFEILVEPKYALFGFFDTNSNSLFYTYFDPSKGGSMVSETRNLNTGNVNYISLPAVREKCVALTDSFWCALDQNLLNFSRYMLTNLYRGELQSTDDWWQNKTNNPVETSFAGDLSTRLGYSVDVTDLKNTGNTLLFRNKLDDTLWKYEL